MNKEFRNIILPLIHGIPILFVFACLGLYAGRRMVQYSNTEYRASAAVKIDNRDAGKLDFQLYNDGGMPRLTSQQNFLTELEVFKSKQLRAKAFEQLNFDITYYRVGEIKKTELYREAPFKIEFTILDSTCMDQLFYLKYQGDQQFVISKDKETIPFDSLQINKKWVNESLMLKLIPNKKLLDKKPFILNTGDVFAFKINSIKALVKSVGEENFFVKPVDKEISILKVYYNHEIPEKAALFTNQLIKTYIADNQTQKTLRSGKTLGFINKILDDATQELRKAEASIADYKSNNNIINTTQETDVVLKRIAQLKQQKVNLEIEDAELNNIFTYMETGGSFNDFSPNFEALKDGVLKDAYLKVQGYELQKIDLLNKYTPTSDEIQLVNEKANSLKAFIGESAKKTVSNLKVKLKQLDDEIVTIEQTLQSYPDKERQLQTMEREVKIREQLYNHLMEKQTEYTIAKSSDISFHQMIDKADIPTAPIWPNKPLIYGVAVFFSLLLGLVVSYLWYFISAKITSKEALGHLLDIPIIGTVSKMKKRDSNIEVMSSLYTNLEIIKKNDKQDKRSLVVTISSMKEKEGKTFVATMLASAAASIGKKVLLVDLNMRNPSVHKLFNLDPARGISAILTGHCTLEEAIQQHQSNLDVIVAGSLENIPSAFVFSSRAEELINSVQESYDFIIFDTPPIGHVTDAMLLMQSSDVNILITRYRKSKMRIVRKLKALITEWKIPRVYALLNGYKRPRKSWVKGFQNVKLPIPKLAIRSKT